MNFFKSKHPEYEHLRKQWLSKNKEISQNLFDKHLKQTAAGALGGLMLLNNSGVTLPLLTTVAQEKSDDVSDRTTILKTELLDKVPSENRNLNREEEKIIADVIKKNTGIRVTAELDGKRLNRSYGLIGGEQHLYRYPGDTLESHAKNTQDWAMFGGAGIAPGLGAWGYFVPSKQQFTKEDEDRERYYIAVQTFLSPGFAENVAMYRDFYKFRKMLVINPKTGQAVVTVIGDAGPGESTGKSLGGSPEVMHDLGLAKGPRKGAVLYFFIDDPGNKIPLGPLKNYNVEELIQT